MKFIRYLPFDFRRGILRNKVLLFTPVVIAAVVFLDFTFKAHRYLTDGVMNGSVSYGDYWFYLCGGMHEYIASAGNAFRFPVVWIVVFLVIPFLLLNYPFQDMYGMGQQILVRAGKRTSWWLSKCCWNFFGTMLYHLIIQMTGVVLALFFQIKISRQINMDFINLAFDVGHSEILSPSVLPLSVLILPVLVSAAINMLQLTLSLLIRPIFSFFAVAVLFLLSAYRLSPFLIGNYAMAFRYDWMLKKGVSLSAGYAIAAVLLFLSVLCGLVRFRFYDILEKE